MTETVRDAAAQPSSRAGEFLTPGDPAYDEARRLHNAMIDKRPSVIARCTSADDVVAALAYAREHGLEVAVRGGGHGVAGTALVEDGLVVDLSRMREVEVDPDRRTARVAGGALMTDLDRACQPHGLATTGGRVSTTGVGGFTLGGGTGWLDRAFGLACDNLVSVDLVTADGRKVTASEDENPDLFWALHGGGGNFGVATSLTLRLHELPVFSAVLMMFEVEDGEAAIREYRDIVESAGDHVSGGCIYVAAPEEDFVPERLVGKVVLLVLTTVIAGEAEARALTGPLRDLGPAIDEVMEMPYADVNCMLDDPPGNRNYWSAEHLMTLPDAAVTAHVAALETMPQPTGCQHVLFAAGGASARNTAGYPVPWRDAPWVVHPFAVWADPADDDRARAWVRQVREAVRPWSTGDVYLNFIGHEGADRVRAGYGEAAWRRLVEVKREWDPGNVFHLNHNIDPD
ncbi:FAD-binding oxidoreductase [Nocardioides sp. GCM10027113]|uniref:FAD-binding oxidoreductase n=1 Tax=unclassified Nocardioides TaxID=2615069 RepID=UPI003610029C